MRLPTAALAACLCACGSPPQQSFFFSFEGSLQGWDPRGIDLAVGDQLEAWSITSDPAAPFDGDSSARFFLQNTNGTGKIWLERSFTLASSGRYRAHLDFAASAASDAGPPDRLIAGFLPSSPRNADQLQAALQPDGITGVAWTPHSYDVEIQGPAVTVVIGIVGASKGPRVDHLDAVTVAFTAR
jgi:hypothetical protein